MLRAKRVISALVRHIAAYSDLVVAAVDEWQTDAARRIALALAGVTLAVSAIVIACGWLLLTIWQSPERHWIAAGLVLLLAGGAVLAIRLARSSPAGPQQSRLKSEWRQDLALMSEARNGTVS